ncbi:MAG: DMT family transporter [Lachnospiraceae bacterium]|nr:DMT family transporter [Lachnospiraceae bacterium]
MNKKTQALIAVIVGNGIFGFSFLFSKLALEVTIPSVLIAVRFSVAFLVLNLIVLLGKRIKKKDGTPLVAFSLKGKPLKPVLLLALFQPVIYFIAENYGIVYTSSSFAGIIIAVIPIAGVVLDILIMRTKVKPKQIICAVASVTGVIITTIGAKDMTSSAKGLALLLVAVVAGALFYVFSKRASASYNPIERTYVMFGVGTVVYVIIAAVQSFGNYDKYVLPAVSAPIFWVAILYLAVVSSVVAFLLLNFGSDHVSVSQATIFANFTTVISIVAGIVVLGEAFTWQQGVGAAVILISVYFAAI